MNWYYSKDSSQHGPVTESKLIELLSNQTLTPESLVWKEGMADWVEAKTISSLFTNNTRPGIGILSPTANANPAPPLGEPAPLHSNPYAAPQADLSRTNQLTNFPIPDVKPVSFKRWCFFFVFGSILLATPYTILIATAITTDYTNESVGTPTIALLGILFLVGLLFLLFALIDFIKIIYRAWKVLGLATHRSPGQAAGFLFIPFFNYYWYFIAFHEWAKEWNKLRQNYGAELTYAPEGKEGTALTLAITQIATIVIAPAGLVAYVCIFVVIKNMSDVVNFFAKSHKK